MRDLIRMYLWHFGQWSTGPVFGTLALVSILCLAFVSAVGIYNGKASHIVLGVVVALLIDITMRARSYYKEHRDEEERYKVL